MYIRENPALYLYDILTEVHQISKAQPRNNTFANTWAEALEVDKDNLDAILKGVMGVLSLYRQTSEIVQDNEELNNDINIQLYK